MSNHTYIHNKNKNQAQICAYDADQVWVVEISQGSDKMIHGFYPSLPSAQLILSALGFEPTMDIKND